MVAVHPVLNGADDSHRADAHGQRSRDKRVHKILVFRIASPFLEPFTEAGELFFQIYDFTNHGAGRKADDHHDCAVRCQRAAADPQHSCHRTADPQKQNSKRIRRHQRILNSGRNPASHETTGESCRSDGGRVNYRTKSGHDEPPSDNLRN